MLITLKTDYFDGATGIQTQLNDVFDQGVIYIACTNLATITSALTVAAGKGQSSFTVTLCSPFEPANLLLAGRHWLTYQAGIVDGLAAQDIYSYEVNVIQNTGCATNLKIDLDFDFYSTVKDSSPTS